MPQQRMSRGQRYAQFMMGHKRRNPDCVHWPDWSKCRWAEAKATQLNVGGDEMARILEKVDGVWFEQELNSPATQARLAKRRERAGESTKRIYREAYATRDRAIVALNRSHNWSVAGLAELFGVHRNTIGKVLRRARNKSGSTGG